MNEENERKKSFLVLPNALFQKLVDQYGGAWKLISAGDFGQDRYGAILQWRKILIGVVLSCRRDDSSSITFYPIDRDKIMYAAKWALDIFKSVDNAPWFYHVTSYRLLADDYPFPVFNLVEGQGESTKEAVNFINRVKAILREMKPNFVSCEKEMELRALLDFAKWCDEIQPSSVDMQWYKFLMNYQPALAIE